MNHNNHEEPVCRVDEYGNYKKWWPCSALSYIDNALIHKHCYFLDRVNDIPHIQECAIARQERMQSTFFTNLNTAARKQGISKPLTEHIIDEWLSDLDNRNSSLF